MQFRNNRPLTAHVSILAAEVCWGLMSPIGKDAMAHGIPNIDLVTFRAIGAAMLFWTASLFAKREHVPLRDILLLGAASLLAVVFNQCLFTIGLSYTSPVNASIVTTSLPIFAMIFSFLILHEPLSAKKVSGVLVGCLGAVILILTSAQAANAKVGDIRGDLLCMAAQCSFALYLSLFSPLVRRYSVFTVNKWMFLWATIFILPLSGNSLATNDWSLVPASAWLEAAYVVVMGTFVCFMLMMVGQKTLRPTVVSIYNNVQPIVSVAVSVAMGLSILRWSQGLAIVLVFTGVWMVTKSNSKGDLATQKEHSDDK